MAKSEKDIIIIMIYDRGKKNEIPENKMKKSDEKVDGNNAPQW